MKYIKKMQKVDSKQISGRGGGGVTVGGGDNQTIFRTGTQLKSPLQIYGYTTVLNLSIVLKLVALMTTFAEKRKR